MFIVQLIVINYVITIRNEKISLNRIVHQRALFGDLTLIDRDGIDQARHDFDRCRFSTTDRARADCARE